MPSGYKNLFRPRGCLTALGPEDVDSVFSLYTEVKRTSPYGFLTSRSRNDFIATLEDKIGSLVVGVRIDGKLVGYSMCRRSLHNPFASCLFLSDLEPMSCGFHVGLGTVVHPDHAGRLFMARMIRELLSSPMVEHMAGLVAVENLTSIMSLMRADAVLVGFAEDETSMNYIAYGGGMRSRLRQEATPSLVAVEDRAEHERLFAAGHVISGLRLRRPARWGFVFSRFEP